MPLHDWTDHDGWEGVHNLWIVELLRWVKPRLPEEYRAYLGTAPTFTVETPTKRPDVGVRSWRPGPEAMSPPGGDQAPAWQDPTEPDTEVAVAEIDPAAALFVGQDGRLVAAVEIISPRNKDRHAARSLYLSRYLGYLLGEVNLIIIDVLPRPAGFSFADRIAEELSIAQPPCPTPMAVSYRVGEPAATGGRKLAIWRRPLAAGKPMPALTLPITADLAIPLELEATYARAAEDAYLT